MKPTVKGLSVRERKQKGPIYNVVTGGPAYNVVTGGLTTSSGSKEIQPSFTTELEMPLF